MKIFKLSAFPRSRKYSTKNWTSSFSTPFNGNVRIFHSKSIKRINRFHSWGKMKRKIWIRSICSSFIWQKYISIFFWIDFWIDFQKWKKQKVFWLLLPLNAFTSLLTRHCVFWDHFHCIRFVWFFLSFPAIK